MRDRAQPPSGTPVARGRPGPPPFERLIEQHGPAVLRFCAAQVGPERAEDVFQETMLSALRAYEGVRDPASVRSWLFAIATRKAIDSHRERAREPQPVPDAEPPDPGDEPGSVGEGIWERVRALPAKQREAVALRFLGALSHREIAQVMETSEAAARRNVFEGLNRLRTEVEP